MILVTGGTGFLGAYLLRYLIQEGYTAIRALKRKQSTMDLVADIADKVEWVESDVEDILGLEDAMRGVQKVYHVAAIVSYDSRDAERMFAVNVEGTANVVNAALQEGVQKMLHVSSTAALGKPKNGQLIDEQTAWEEDSYTTNYSRSKHFSEMQAWRGLEEGLDTVILNPSVILGSGFWDRGPAKIFKNAWNEFPFYPMGGTGFVDVRDVARMAIQLMESDIVGERFLCVAENCATATVMQKISDALGKQPPHIKATPVLQSIAWRVAYLQSLFTNRRPLITKEIARQSSKTTLYDHHKSKERLGFIYTPIDSTIQATATQLKVAALQNFQPMCLPLN
ncbi:MAG: NAD-dependent epimerase/dehydratase family protein [Bacteroidota bacterium]